MNTKYSHTTQISAINERKFYQNMSCQKAEVHLTQRKREITGITFLSGKLFCRNVEINAINLTAVVDSKLDFFLKVLVKSSFAKP